MNDAIELTGLDGSNPLAFLATLGVLRLLTSYSDARNVRLAWNRELRPEVHLDASSSLSIADVLLGGLRDAVDEGVASLGDIIGVPVEQYRDFCSGKSVDIHQRSGMSRLMFAAAFASDAVVDSTKGTVTPNALSFSNKQGGKLLLKDFKTLVSQATSERVRAALFDRWCYLDTGLPTFRWDPLDMRTGAHMATSPTDTETTSVMAANAIAFMGLSYLPTTPADNSLSTTAVNRLDGELHLTWPIWQTPLMSDVVASLLQRCEWPDDLGIIGRFASRRIMYKKNLYLGGSTAM
jgi:hypothetical protein